MPAPTQRNGSRSLVVERALEEGLRKASEPSLEEGIIVNLDATQERMLGQMCTTFGLSVRSVLNASLRYALREATTRGQALNRLREYPRKPGTLPGTLELTVETRALVREANAADFVPGATVAGLKLLHSRTLKDSPKR